MNKINKKSKKGFFSTLAKEETQINVIISSLDTLYSNKVDLESKSKEVMKKKILYHIKNKNKFISKNKKNKKKNDIIKIIIKIKIKIF